jgi:N-acetylglucosaminyldiphosphoundecaprenol N-acetyl-beta-D-mannosaminyltransferase
VTSLLGLTFSDLTAAQSATRLAERPASSPFGYVVTPNADHLVRISRDAGLCELYRNAILCQLDSRVVGGLAWLLGLTAPVVAPGSDLTAELLTRHLQPGERITIIGLSPVWLQALVRRFGLAAPAHYDPPMGFDRYQAGIDAAVAFVVANPARFVFLAVGSPRQEHLAAAIFASGDATGIGLCIGASLEFLAGARRRAPGLLQRTRLEWLYRFLTDPRRLARRYLIDSPVVIALLWKERLAAGRSEQVLRR